MPTQKDSGRKDTGRVDKYSDETPKKDYQDFRKDNSSERIVRISKELDPVKSVGSKSLDVRKQELISHIQNFKETFSNADKKAWMNRKDELVRALESNS